MTMIMENYKSSQHTGVVGKRKYNDGEDITQPVTATSLKIKKTIFFFYKNRNDNFWIKELNLRSCYH